MVVAGGQVEGPIPGDPKECRRRAARCAELATTARNEQLGMTLVALSKSWMKLAIELENAQELVAKYPPESPHRRTCGAEDRVIAAA